MITVTSTFNVVGNEPDYEKLVNRFGSEAIELEIEKDKQYKNVWVVTVTYPINFAENFGKIIETII